MKPSLQALQRAKLQCLFHFGRDRHIPDLNTLDTRPPPVPSALFNIAIGVEGSETDSCQSSITNIELAFLTSENSQSPTAGLIINAISIRP